MLHITCPVPATVLENVRKCFANSLNAFSKVWRKGAVKDGLYYIKDMTLLTPCARIRTSEENPFIKKSRETLWLGKFIPCTLIDMNAGRDLGWHD